MLMCVTCCVSCFGLVFSTCQVIGYRKTPLMTPSWGEEIISTKPRWKRVFVCIFSSVWFVSVAVCFPRPYTIYIHTPMTRYSLLVLKVPLNTKQTNYSCLIMFFVQNCQLCSKHAFEFLWIMSMVRFRFTYDK